MDEVDGLILSVIKNLGCEIDAKRIGDLTNEHIFEAIARCAIQIKPNSGFNTIHLPPNMGSRFRLGTEMASLIKEIGYKEEIGYQTILYGNETEIRRLLMFLTERLPKQIESEVLVAEKSIYDDLLTSTSACLRKQLDAPWIPWFCRRQNYFWDGKYWSPLNPATSKTSFLSSPLNFTETDKPFTQQLPKNISLEPSIITHTSRLRLNLDLLNSKPSTSFLSMLEKQKAKAMFKKEKPKLPPKPKPKAIENVSENVVVSEKLDVESEPELKRKAVDSLKVDIETIEFDLKQIHEYLSKYSDRAFQVRAEYAASQERLAIYSEQLKSRQRFADLLPGLSDNVQKLKDHLANSDNRMENLSTTWESHREVLLNQLTVVKAKQGEKSEYQRLKDETDEIAQKLETFRTDIVEKQKFATRLKAEYEKIEKAVSRTFYTKRILEIVANVRKQKEEIDRVLVDVRGVQKDINMLAGKLDRTFTAIDEIMFDDAKKDDLIRRAYKIVVNLHENCGEVVSNIENIGHILRDVRDFEDKIEIEAQNSVDNKLEQLVNNYCEIKQENETIILKIAKLTGVPPEFD